MASPYDQSFKSLADYDPEAFLRWMGVLRPQEPVTILALPRELHTPTRVADLLYKVRSGETWRLVHIEAQTRYHSSLPERVLQYAALSWLHHRLPVVSHVLLLTARGCPAALTDQREASAGDLRMRYTHIKLWELAPDQVLASDWPNLWPFVPLMRSEAFHLRLAAQRLRRIPNEEDRRDLSAQFIVLGCLRYDRNDLLRLLEGVMITLEDLEESSFYQFILEKGIERGIEQGIERGIERGIEQGIGQGEARLLRRQLEQRFGALPSWAVEKIQTADLDVVEAWGMRLLRTSESRLEDLLD